ISDAGPELDEVSTFAPIFGIHAAYMFTPKVSIRIEGNYAPINQKYKGTDSAFSFTGKDRANYFNIPILLQLWNKSGKFYFEIGPQFSFLTSAKSEISGLPSIDDKENFKSTVISGTFGLGGNFMVAENIYIQAGL